MSPLAERIRDARARLAAALAPVPVVGRAEAALPFGLSRVRMEHNAHFARSYPGEASTKLQRVVAEIIEAGLAEERRVDFVVALREGKWRCVVIHHLCGGETYETF